VYRKVAVCVKKLFWYLGVQGIFLRKAMTCGGGKGPYMGNSKMLEKQKCKLYVETVSTEVVLNLSASDTH